MTESKPHLRNRHRWILPAAILGSVGGVWLLNVWTRQMRPDIMSNRASLWEQFLPYAVWTLLFLGLVYLAATAPRRKGLGVTLLAVGICAWGLQLYVSPSWRGLYSEAFQRWVLNPYLTELMFRPYNLFLARAMLWIGILLFLPQGRNRQPRSPQRRESTRAWLASFAVLVGVVGSFAVAIRFLPAPRSYGALGSVYTWWPLHMRDLGVLLTSVVTVVAWIRLSETFARNRWSAIPWIVAGAAGISVIAVARHPSMVRTIYAFLYRTLAGPARFFELTAQVFWIGVLGFLIASWRRVRSGNDAGSSIVGSGAGN